MGGSMATLNIRLDDETHDEFTKFCETVGMSASTLFSVFAKTIVREQKIPFEISATAKSEERPNRTTIRAMKEGDRFIAKYAKNPEKYNKNPKKYGLYDNVEELFEDMKKW